MQSQQSQDQTTGDQPEQTASQPSRDRGSFFQINILEAVGVLILSVLLYHWMLTDPSVRYHRAVQESQIQAQP